MVRFRRRFRRSQTSLGLKMPLSSVPSKMIYPCIRPICIHQTLYTAFIRDQFRINSHAPQFRLISNLILPFPTRPTITYPPTNRAPPTLSLTQHIKRILIKLPKQIPKAVCPITPLPRTIHHLPHRMANLTSMTKPFLEGGILMGARTAEEFFDADTCEGFTGEADGGFGVEIVDVVAA